MKSRMPTRLWACAAALALAGAAIGCTGTRPGGGGGLPSGGGGGMPGMDHGGSGGGDTGGGMPGMDHGGSGGGGGGGAVTGAEPTEQALLAARGPFQVRQTRVMRGNGFGGGTINYPVGVQGKVGGIVVVPGFMSLESSIAWWGPRIASWGYVVMTIDTNTVGDFPPQRSQQQQSAFRVMQSNPAVSNMIDGSKLVAQGWSMGGGGSLQTAQINPNVKVVVPMAPWNPGSTYRYSKPVFILSCMGDAIAGNSMNSDIFYAGLQGPKAQLTLAAGNHFCPTTPNNQAAKFVISWIKKYLDGDNRFTKFICGVRAPATATSYRTNCS